MVRVRTSAGVALAAPGAQPAAQDGRAEFILSNTGKRAPTPATLHPDDATRFLNADVYRIFSERAGRGLGGADRNALATVPFGGINGSCIREQDGQCC